MLPVSLIIGFTAGLWLHHRRPLRWAVLVVLLSSVAWAAMMGGADGDVITAVGGFAIATINASAGLCLGWLARSGRRRAHSREV